MPNSVYWDSCLFIEVIQKNNQDRYDACAAMLKDAEKEKLLIVTSSLAIVEVNKDPDSGSLTEAQSKTILGFFENPYIVVRTLDRPTAELAHAIVRADKLGNADAIHVATAIIAKVPVLYTYDGKGKGKKGLIKHHLKIGNPPLRIEVPPLPSFPLLDHLPADQQPAPQAIEPATPEPKPATATPDQGATQH